MICATRQRPKLIVLLRKRPLSSDRSPPSETHNLLRQLDQCPPNQTSFRQIHAQFIVSGALLDAFAASRLLKFLLHRLHPPDLPLAGLLLPQIPRPDIVSFNLLLEAQAQASPPLHSFLLFRQLLHRGLRPNGYTFCFLLRACPASPFALQLHAQLSKNGLAICPFAATALLQSYAADPVQARKLFNEMLQKTQVSWAVMAGVYAAHGRLRLALGLLLSSRKAHDMELCNSALVSVLSICAKLGEVFLGKMVHGLITVMGLELNVTLGTSLMELYARSGGLAAAAAVFTAMPRRSVGSWNCLIHGLAINGGAAGSMAAFEEMKKMRVKADEGTFVGLLTACRHAGSVVRGAALFAEMVRLHQMAPNLKHFGCLVDLYARAGHVPEALELAGSMPMAPDAAIWGAILGACRASGDGVVADMVAARMAKMGALKRSPALSSLAF
ncbi:pentatricopeptide repeat-containing protein At5g66520-like [Wolffia australiana]